MRPGIEDLVRYSAQYEVDDCERTFAGIAFEYALDLAVWDQ